MNLASDLQLLPSATYLLIVFERKETNALGRRIEIKRGSLEERKMNELATLMTPLMSKIPVGVKESQRRIPPNRNFGLLDSG